MRIAVLVPRRADQARRDRLWEHVAGRWAADHPTWTVVEGLDPGPTQPFNRSACINAAARAAGEWDVAIIADADSFVGADQSLEAVNVALRTGRITFAYDRFVYLDRDMSDQVMAGYRGNWWDGAKFTMTGTCSSMVAVTRQLWDAVGGFDEGFVGWGGEDIGFSLACQALGGGFERVPGDVWHLYHDPAPHTHDDVWPARVEMYKGPDGDPTAMTELLRELGVLPAAAPPAKARRAAKKATA